MKKRMKALTALLCVSAMVTGCGASGNSGTDAAKTDTQKEGTKEAGKDGENQEKSEVTIGFSSEGDSFDPCTGFGYTGSPIYSTLVKINGDEQIENDLATEYTTSEDALTWTFKIRDDVKFTNGEPLKASDIAFTFNTTKEKATYMDLTMLESCKALDDTTVEFKLSKPCVTFIYTVAQMGIVPEKAYSDKFGLEADQIIGSGPYKMVQWDKGQQFILEANEDYYGKQPEIKTAVFLIQDEDARFVAAKAGEVDIALTSATLATTELDGMHVEKVESVDNRGITMPTVSGEISYKGKVLSQKEKEALRGKEMALVPQSVSYLDPLMKVGTQVRGRKADKEIIKAQREIFRRFHLDEKTEQLYPFQLSGGMARRVLVSTAVLSGAEVIIADEPTPGLDLEMALEALKIFRELSDEGKAVILITHDIDLAFHIADRIAVFYAGTTVEIAAAKDFLEGVDALRHPYSKALWKALPQNGFEPIPGFQPYAKYLPKGCLFSPRCPHKTKECEENIPMREVRGGYVRCIHAD